MPPRKSATLQRNSIDSQPLTPIVVHTIDVTHFAQLAKDNDSSAAAQSSAKPAGPSHQQSQQREVMSVPTTESRRQQPSQASNEPISTAVVAVSAAPSSSSSAVSPPSPPTAVTVIPARAVESVSKRAIKEAAGGLGASIFSAVCVYPIDLVKTRMQLPNSPITSLFGGMNHILREEGFTTLYTGLGSELIKCSLQNFSYFYWYAVFKEVATERVLAANARKQAALLAGGHAADGTQLGAGFLRKNSSTSSGVSAADELRLHQAACVDTACFCRSEVHVHAHSEAHRAKTQVDVWREKALQHQQHRAQKERLLRKAQQQAQQQRLAAAPSGNVTTGPDSATSTPRMIPSVSEPSLTAGMSQHDLDDSPYVDVHSVEQSALITNTATVHPPLPPLGLQHAGTGVTVSPVTSVAVASASLPASPERGSPGGAVVVAAVPTGPVLSIPMQLFLGTVAGCFTQMLVNPVSVVQTRMMTRQRTLAQKGVVAVAGAAAVAASAAAAAAGQQQLGFFGLAAHIFRSEGISVFFSGLMPAFILSTNPSIQFLVFDRLKALLLRVLRQSGAEERNLSIAESFLLGAISKVVATLVTYPYILVKTRLSVKGTQYKGTMDVLLRVLRHEGFTGLYTGLQAQLLKSVLGAALMFMAKEKLADLAQWSVKKLRQHTPHKDAQQQPATRKATTAEQPAAPNTAPPPTSLASSQPASSTR